MTMRICGNINVYFREMLCGYSDHSIQIAPPPILLKSDQLISINDDRNMAIIKSKKPPLEPDRNQKSQYYNLYIQLPICTIVIYSWGFGVLGFWGFGGSAEALPFSR